MARPDTLPPMAFAPATTLLLLAFGNFVVGMGAFVVVAVLTPVATAFGISKAEAGWLMTAYAIVYAVASPILVALTGRFDRRLVLAGGLALFLLGSVIAFVAPSYTILLAGRMVMAVGGGLVTPVAASIGVALSAPENRGKALATVFGGLTLAQVLGVPAGAFLGYALGWRVAFEVVAMLSLAGLMLTWFALPKGIETPRASLAALGATLTTPRLVTAVAFTALFVGGLYTIYTYLAPFLEARLSLGRDGVTAMLVIFGLGAVAGNALGGALTDKIGPVKTLAILCVAQIVVMPALSLIPLGLVATAIVIAIWSVFAWSFMVAQQARLAALDPTKTPILFALNAAAIYVGGSIGSLVGGVTLEGPGIAMLGVAGAALIAVAAGTLWVVGRMGPR